MATRNANNTTLSAGTASVTQKLAADVNKAQARKHELAQAYSQEKKVRVTGSPMYSPYFGNNMPIQINGISVYVPLDGRAYEIPKTFADVFKTRIARIDALIQKQGAMADFIEENSPGEVQLINEA